MPDLTLLAQRRESRISWAWANLTETVPTTRLVGVFILVLAAATVGAGLAGPFADGWWALPLYGCTLVTLVGLGSWLVLLPSDREQALVVALTLGPVVWTAMVFTWNDDGHVVTPVALVYTGAAAAAFCGLRVLTLQIALDVGATLIYIAKWSSENPSAIPGRAATHILAVVLFTVGVYVARRRAERLRASFHARSVLDELTGLPNRRHVQSVSPALLASALRQEREIYALVLDVDRLTSINDRLGVAVGDDVISGVAKVARQALRPEDLLARIGGEEFLAAGLVRSQFEAVRIAERLRLAIRRAHLNTEVTVSIGVATARPSTGVDPVEWMWNLTAVAEESLAAAKASGRDRVAPARQSGDVLGDALEVVTAGAGVHTLSDKPPEPGSTRWVSADVIARAVGTLGIIGALLMVISYLAPGQDPPPQQWNLPLQVIVAAGATIYLTASLAVMMRPRLSSWLLPMIVFCADALWAASALVIPPPDRFLGLLPVVIMCGFAAWVFRLPLFIAQLVITYPLVFVVMRGSQLPIVEAILDAMLQGTAITAAAAALYLLRRHSEDLIAQSAESSTIDQTTGLPNRRLLQERAPALVAGAARQAVPVNITIIDLEEFWLINERFGYSAGDKVLAEVGRVLYRTSRAEDTLVRLTGVNFVIAGIGDPDDARRNADRAAAAVNGIWAYGHPLRTTMGFAVARPESGVDPVPWLMALVADAGDLVAEQRAETAGTLVGAGSR